jgi:6-phosphogluconate dehydrogenase
VIDDLLPGLDAGDILIDGGNSHFQDTVRRGARLRGLGLGYVGAGISGGAEGARHGASLMVGADAADYAACRPIFEALAARVDGAPCAARVGPDGAGHFVKMVHNGIEYALMQLIAETWRTMTDVLGWSRARQREAFAVFERGPAASFLVGITTAILAVPDPERDGYLLDSIADRAAQKGTGRWTLEAALELGVPVPTIAAAVTERMISAGRRLGPGPQEGRPATAWSPGAETLEAALAAGFIASFAQGFDLLAAASKANDWRLDLAEVARIWQGGCIVRAELLRAAEAAFRADPGRGSLLEAVPLRAQLAEFEPRWREFVAGNAAAGTAAPCASAALAWYDSLRAAQLPTNLIQAQRDYFGAHGFERTDRPGRFHGTWRRR